MGTASSFFSVLINTLWTWTLLGVSILVGFTVSQQRDLESIPGFDTLPSFLSIPLLHQTESTIVFTLAGVIAGFLIFFLTSYVWQAVLDFIRLMLVSLSLKRAINRANKTGSINDSQQDLKQWKWFYYPLMNHLWREYAETLHRQSLPNEGSEPQHIQYRSTVPAEALFSTQALVDVPMRVEFFRHLPGILTGAGIVSTFAGILLGLSEFNPAVEAQHITLQLKNLFSGVTTAFVASFFAIFTAILVTIVEKFLLHWRYAQVTSFQHRLDDLFQTGVEPEYLATLVSNGEAGFIKLQTEMARIADGLNTFSQQPSQSFSTDPKLKPLLDLYIDKLSQNQTNVGQHLKKEVETILAEPLSTIARGVSKALEIVGRRRDDGRSLEVKLITVGESLNVTLETFANSMVELKQEMADRSNTLETLLNRQMDLLEKMESGPQKNGGNLALEGVQKTVAEMAVNLEKMVVSLHGEAESNRDHATKLLDKLSQGVTKSLDTLIEVLPPTEEIVTTLRENQTIQSDALNRVQTLLEPLVHTLPNEEGITTAIRTTLEKQASTLSHWQKSLDSLSEKLPTEEVVVQRVKDTLKAQGLAFQQWTRSLDGLFKQLPSREEFIKLVEKERQPQTQALQAIQDILQNQLDQALDQLKEQKPQVQILEAIQETLDQAVNQLQEQQPLKAIQDRLDQALDQLQEQKPQTQSLKTIQETLDQAVNQLQEQEPLKAIQDTLDLALDQLQEQKNQTQALDAIQGTLNQSLDQLQEQKNQTQALEAIQGTLNQSLDQLSEQKNQTQTLKTIQDTLSQALDQLKEQLPQNQTLQNIQDTLHQAVDQLPNKENLADFLTETRNSQLQILETFQTSLEHLSNKLPNESAWADLFRDHQEKQAAPFLELKQTLNTFPDRLIEWSDTQNKSLHSGMLQTFSNQLEQTANHMAQQFKQLEGQIVQERSQVQATLQGLLEGVSESLQETVQKSEQHASQHISQAVQQATESNQITGEKVMDHVKQAIISKESDKQVITTALSDISQRMETELVELRNQFQETSNDLAEKVSHQAHELSLLRAVDSGNKLQAYTDQLASEIKLTLHDLIETQQQRNLEQTNQLTQHLKTGDSQLVEQIQASLKEGQQRQLETEQTRAEANAEVAEKVVETLSLKLEKTFGSLADGLSELRERFSSEQGTIVQTMESWIKNNAQSDAEKSQKIDTKITEVISNVNTHHTDLIRVIDHLSQNLNNDLDQLRRGLVDKNEESSKQVTDQVTHQVNELGRLLEGVVQSVGQEQTAFIEMLGERLDTLRRRLRVK